jgi:hypothetical protein
MQQVLYSMKTITLALDSKKPFIIGQTSNF